MKPGTPSAIRRAVTVLRSALSSSDAWIARAGSEGVGFVAWPALIGGAVGLTLWMVAHFGQLPLLSSNSLSRANRSEAFFYVAGGVAGMFVAVAALAGFLRWRRGAWDVGGASGRLNRPLSCLVAVPLMLSLRIPLERTEPIVVALIALLSAVFVARTAYYVAGPLGGTPHPERRRDRASIACLIVLVCAYTLVFSNLAIGNHRGLNTSDSDLARYVNLFYQSAHGVPLGCSYANTGYHFYTAHFDPILVLLSPIYRLHEDAETILVLQSLWLGSTQVPLYLLARHLRHGRVVSLLLCVTFFLYPALHGVNLFEFHSLALVVPLVVWLVYLIHIGARLAYFVVFVLALTVREDVPFITALIGVYAMTFGNPRAARLGWVTLLSSVIYFVCVKTFIMTGPPGKTQGLLDQGGGGGMDWARYYYSELVPSGERSMGIIKTLFTNPTYVLNVVFTREKLSFFFKLFVPLLFLPFFAPRGKIMMLFGGLFLFLATRPALYSTNFQYSSVLFPVLFALVPIALAGIRDGVIRVAKFEPPRLVVALAFGMVCSSAVMSSKFGAILPNSAFEAGFRPLVRKLTGADRANFYWIRSTIRERIPVKAAVTGTFRLSPHFANRMKALFWTRRVEADYVFVYEPHLKREPMWTQYKSAVHSGELVQVTRRGEFILYKTHWSDKTKKAYEKERWRPGKVLTPEGARTSVKSKRRIRKAKRIEPPEPAPMRIEPPEPAPMPTLDASFL